MRKIECEFFGPGQEGFLTIERLEMVERQTSKSLTDLKVFMQHMTLSDIAAIFSVAFGQYGRRPPIWYSQKMQELVDEEEANIEDFGTLAIKLLVASGIYGKEVYYRIFPNERPTTEMNETKNE